jgi:hypothetical protein
MTIPVRSINRLMHHDHPRALERSQACFRTFRQSAPRHALTPEIRQVLSPSGCLQLATDVSYLASILKTLGAPGTDKLNDVQRLLEAKDEDFAQVYQ